MNIVTKLCEGEDDEKSGNCVECGNELSTDDKKNGYRRCERCSLKDAQAENRRVRRIVSVLVEDDSHRGLWDQLIAKAEAGDEQLNEYLDLIADIYNGGIQQCIEHGRGADELLNVAGFLRGRGGPASLNLANVLRGLRRSYTEAAEAYEADVSASRHGERRGDEDGDPFAPFLEDFDAAENFIYSHENMDAVHRELLSGASNQAPLVSQ